MGSCWTVHYPHGIPSISSWYPHQKNLSFRYVMEVQFNMFMGCIILSYYHGFILSSRVFVLSIMHNINDILWYISIYIYIFISIYIHITLVTLSIYQWYPLIHQKNTTKRCHHGTSGHRGPAGPAGPAIHVAEEMIFLQEPKGDTTRNYHSSMVIISIHDKHININDKHSIYIYYPWLSIFINITIKFIIDIYYG